MGDTPVCLWFSPPKRPLRSSAQLHQVLSGNPIGANGSQLIRVDSQSSRCYKRSGKSYWRQSLADHPSVEKRYRQSVKRRARNIEIKSRLRTLMKKTRQAIEAKNLDAATGQIQSVNKALGKAVSKGIVKKNTASRWLSRLSRAAHRSKSAS